MIGFLWNDTRHQKFKDYNETCKTNSKALDFEKTPSNNESPFREPSFFFHKYQFLSFIGCFVLH